MKISEKQNEQSKNSVESAKTKQVYENIKVSHKNALTTADDLIKSEKNYKTIR